MRVSHINFSEKGSPAAWRRDPTLVTVATRQSGDNKSPERTPPPRAAQESESRLSPQSSIPKPLGKQEVPEIPMVLAPQVMGQGLQMLLEMYYNPQTLWACVPGSPQVQFCTS